MTTVRLSLNQSGQVGLSGYFIAYSNFCIVKPGARILVPWLEEGKHAVNPEVALHELQVHAWRSA